MWGAWGILGMIQVISNRYLKVYWKFNKLIHVISGTAILAITLTMGFLAIKKGDWEIEINWHSIMGIIVMGCVSAIVLGGFFAAIMM